MVLMGKEKGLSEVNEQFVKTRTRGVHPKISLKEIGLSGEYLDECVHRYRLIAAEILAAEAEWIDGAPETLEELRRQSHLLGIVTTAGKITSEAIRTRLHLDEFIPTEWIINGNDVKEPKPSPEGILMLTERMNVPVRRSTFSGDHNTDVRAGNTAGCRGSFLVKGEHTLDGEEEGATGVANTTTELGRILLTF